MCGIVGWINNKKNIKNNKFKFRKMVMTLKRRGPDNTGYFIKDNVLFGHKRLSVIDLENGKQPMSYNGYTIIYNGELYNTEYIKGLLLEVGYNFETTSDTEVLLKGYIHFKEKILEIIEGIYAFAIYHKDEIFIVRDRLGVKPLFYIHKNNNFVFASEIKAILKSEVIKPIIDKKSLQELFALGPSHTPGSGIFKDIFELKPGFYMTYKKNKIKLFQYWNVSNTKNNDSFEECKKKVKEMLIEAIKRQMVSDVPIATLLSGGLDSSIITAIVALEMKKENKKLTTYSIDYEENAKFFKSNSFQVSEDKKYIEIMKKRFNTNHIYKVISQQELAEFLKDAMIARDLPGMADIDSSLYWFSKEIKKEHTVILSGECADEIFGGYPWFYKEELLNKKFFPWINDLEKRNNLLNKKIRKKLSLKKYAIKKYSDTLKEVPKVKDKNIQKYKNLFYLNMKWFMTTLLERKDRMTMYASVEARVPFSDHKLIEYLWNIPFEYKFYQGVEKGLLRESFAYLLPEEIKKRKKNPYPKTHHPVYTDIVCDLLKKRLEKNSVKFYQIFDKEEIENLLNSKGASYQVPWFGQLMTGPQLIAYLYQFHLWLDEYEVILKI